ncbi:hypothetical protein FLGE108171_16070 [Flavobacterium gelidilacus]|uniref:hypothetical protein n=1 Tax=Flavobacterium gelidilacus TaxID=206041 RepID=UPI0039EFCF1C
MEKIFFKLIFLLIFVVVLQSCSEDDNYTDLSIEAKNLLFYEVGDTFQLKNLITDEIITLSVNSKTFDYYKESNPGFWLAGSTDNYYEYGNYNFSDVTNCYTGNISVEARKNSNFELTAYIGECFGNINNSFEYQSEFLQSIVVDGITYFNVYLIRSYSQIIFYSQDKGIIKIVDEFSQETQFIIVE